MSVRMGVKGAGRITGLLLAGLALALPVGSLSADSFDDGYAAYQRGEFSDARKLWTGLAEAGDARAVQSRHHAG